jgi:hypothetical protein
MGRRADPVRLAEAKAFGRAARLRDQLLLNKDAELERRHREEWPELWEAIDRLTELITW